MRCTRVLLVVVSVCAAPLAHGQSLEIVSVDGAGAVASADCRAPSLADDASRIAFESVAADLVAGDGNGASDVFVRDRVSGTTVRVSVATGGAEAHGDSRAPRISADGRVVAFESDAPDLVAGDGNGATDVFVHELATGTTTLVSRTSGGSPGSKASTSPRLSADGRFVVFTSLADDLIPSDGNDVADVFLHDRQLGLTIRVSVSSTGREADGPSFSPAITRDGLFVAFSSDATNLSAADGDDLRDVFVRDVAAGTTTLASSGAGGKGDDVSDEPALSDDGRLVAFTSFASNLVAGDSPETLDVFVRDLASGIVVPADVDSDGEFGVDFASQSASVSISADGRFVTFSAPDGGFAPDDSNHWDDEFVHDFATPLTSRTSIALDGTQSDGASGGSSISADGRFLVFTSAATTLAPGANGARQIHLRERRLDPASWSSYGAGHPGTNGIPALAATADPVLNRTMGLAIGNSSGTWTFGLLFLGSTPVQWPTGWDGDLLVDPQITIVVPIAPPGSVFAGEVPPDERLIATSFFAQVLQIDPGASDGVAFTPGVELVFGL